MVQTSVGTNHVEFLRIADAAAREKLIDRAILLSAMEDAIQKAATLRYGSENRIEAHIDPKTGKLQVLRLLEVVEHVENSAREISLTAARREKSDAAVGDFFSEELPAFDLGRVAAQSAKHVIVQRVREAERERQYHEYKDRKGEIVNGTVKRVEYGDVIVDLGHAEGVMRRADALPRENLNYGDRIRAYIQDVRQESRGPQIFLSRAHNQFMAKLFAQEVPEIYDGIIEIRSVARDPGSRAKIAVVSKDTSIDPVGACVGMRGSRVQAVVNELHGEKVDIIPWSPEPASFIVNALAPAEVVKVVLDEGIQRIEVVVPNDQLPRAIGRRGQNVRLASQLTGWEIDILTEAEESERRQKEFVERSEAFISALDVDEMVGQLLASEGFVSVEELACVDYREVSGIEGFDEEMAQEIQARAKEHLAREESLLEQKCQELGVADSLRALGDLSLPMLIQLGENDIKTLEDFAGCVPDDLLGWVERSGGDSVHHRGILSDFSLGRGQIADLIMEARRQVGWVAPEETEAEVEEGDEGSS